MPELCRFFGIIITMFYDDHPPRRIFTCAMVSTRL
jgi:hypothetical protein